MVSLGKVRTGFRAARRLRRIPHGSAPTSASSPAQPTASAKNNTLMLVARCQYYSSSEKTATYLVANEEMTEKNVVQLASPPQRQRQA
eukprot:2467041-Pleurochrysis_carterae.AAC.1